MIVKIPLVIAWCHTPKSKLSVVLKENCLFRPHELRTKKCDIKFDHVTLVG